jgi:hypothetical protein
MQHQQSAILYLALFDHVDPGDAKLDAPIAHADDNITRTLEKHVQLGQHGDARFVLPRIGLIHFQSAGVEEFVRIVSQATFGWQRDAYHGGRFRGSSHWISYNNGRG